jgi:hypothetical protein
LTPAECRVDRYALLVAIEIAPDAAEPGAPSVKVTGRLAALAAAHLFPNGKVRGYCW